MNQLYASKHDIYRSNIQHKNNAVFKPFSRPMNSTQVSSNNLHLLPSGSELFSID